MGVKQNLISKNLAEDKPVSLDNKSSKYFTGKRYEYKEIPEYNLSKMNSMGSEGWKLVHREAGLYGHTLWERELVN